MDISRLLKKIGPSRLHTQLVLGIAGILVVLMSLLVIVLVNRQKKFFLKLNHDRAFSLSTTLAATANSYVTSYELAALQKLVSTYKDNPGLQYAIVTSGDGIVLAHTDKKYLGLKAIDSISLKLKSIKTIQTLIENESMLDIAAPIINHDEIIGWARVSLSQEYVGSNLKEIEKNGLLFILISLIAGSVFAMFVAGRLSKGLQKLVSAAKKIKDGNREIRVGTSKSFEIAELETAFNQMLDDISSKEKLLSMVLENMPIGVFILDEKGTIVSINPAGKEMWKGERYVGVDEFNVYKGWFTQTGKELQSHEWGGAIAITEGRPVLDQEIEIECFDKSSKVVLNSGIPLQDANEKIIGAIVINVDITERKKAEDALQKSNEQYSQLFNQMLSGLIVYDVIYDASGNPYDYRMVQANPAFERLTGLSAKQQVGRTSKDLVTKWSEDMRQKLYEVAMTGEPFQYERFNPELGKIIETRVFSPRKGQFAHIFNDITERKNAEVAVKEQAETFSAIIENANESIWLLSPDLKVLQFNKTAKERLQLNRGKEIYIGANFKEFLYIGTENVFMPMFNEALAGRYIEEESSQLSIHGNTFWLRTKMYPVYDTQKKLIGVTVLSENITNRKEIEIALAQSEERNRALVENIGDGIVLINKNREVVYQSPSVERINGYTLQERKGLSAEKLIYKDDISAYRDFLQEVYNNPRVPMQAQVRVVHKNGDIIWLEGSMVNMLDNESVKAIIINYRDVSEKHLYEQKLTKAAIKAQEEERYEIGGELHDNVCQLLATSLMFLGLIKKHLPEQSVKFFDQSNGFIHQAADEIRNLSHRLAPVFFDEETLEDALAKLLKTFNAANNYHITLALDDATKQYVLPRDMQLNLYRILQEQLRNIIKHAKATEIDVTITTKNFAALQMKIVDNGIGFDAGAAKGGIGLANMNRRAQLFSGTFTIDSAIGKGCEVVVEIPLSFNK